MLYEMTYSVYCEKLEEVDTDWLIESVCSPSRHMLESHITLHLMEILRREEYV